jgi:hypothetical protein
MSEAFEMSPLGPEGDVCTICKAPLAVDQRYCLQCGQRRGASRVDFTQLIPAEEIPAAVVGAGQTAVEVRAPAQGPWTPLALVGSIATLGLMLLLGVMIGKDDSPSQVTAAAPAAAPTVASTGASGTDGTSAATNGSAATDTKGNNGSTDAAKTKTAADKSQPASEAPGATTIDDGALQALDNATGQDAADASKNLPDTIALPGEPPPTDNAAPGAGGPAQVIK